MKVYKINTDPRGEGRQWEKRLELNWFDGPFLSLNMYLTFFEGKSYPNWLISGYSLGFKIKDWKIESDHQYYDGENCFWQFGPFTLSRFGVLVGCKKSNAR